MQHQLIETLEDQIIDLTTISKIELNDDAIETIKHLKKTIEKLRQKIFPKPI